jgi:hypothetical protein
MLEAMNGTGDFRSYSRCILLSLRGPLNAAAFRGCIDHALASCRERLRNTVPAALCEWLDGPLPTCTETGHTTALAHIQRLMARPSSKPANLWGVVHEFGQEKVFVALSGHLRNQDDVSLDKLVTEIVSSYSNTVGQPIQNRRRRSSPQLGTRISVQFEESDDARILHILSAYSVVLFLVTGGSRVAIDVIFLRPDHEIDAIASLQFDLSGDMTLGDLYAQVRARFENVQRAPPLSVTPHAALIWSPYRIESCHVRIGDLRISVINSRIVGSEWWMRVTVYTSGYCGFASVECEFDDHTVADLLLHAYECISKAPDLSLCDVPLHVAPGMRRSR